MGERGRERDRGRQEGQTETETDRQRLDRLTNKDTEIDIHGGYLINHPKQANVICIICREQSYVPKLSLKNTWKQKLSLKKAKKKKIPSKKETLLTCQSSVQELRECGKPWVPHAMSDLRCFSYNARKNGKWEFFFN